MVKNNSTIDNVIQLIERHPNWRNALKKRHQKFVLSFIKNEYDVFKVARDFYFAKEDMLSIFVRIERSLIEHDEMQKELAKQKSYTALLEELDESSKDIFKQVLVKSEKINIHKVYPKRLAEYIQTIIETKNIDKTAELMGVGKQYLISRITGRRKPRKPCEQGALYYLKNHSETA